MNTRRASSDSPITNAPSFDRESQVALSAFLRGRVCILGVGNRHRGDDGIGPSVIDARPPSAPGIWIDAGSTPENYLEVVVRSAPDVLLIVDAVDFGGLPGESRLLDLESVDSTAVSTHCGSLRLLGDYVGNRCQAKTRILAVQPQDVGHCAHLSAMLASCVEWLAWGLSQVMSENRVTPCEPIA